MKHDFVTKTEMLPYAPEAAMILECRGPIVFHWEACCFRTVVLGALSIHNSVQLDLTNVPVVDAFGLGTLVEVYSQARSWNKSLQIVSTSPFVHRLLGLTSLDQFLRGTGSSSLPVMIREQVA